MTRKIWKQFTPFCFYTLLSLALGVAAMISETRSLTNILFLCLTGIVTWGLIEYGMHRLVFHFDAQSEKGRNYVYAMHLSHHANPKTMDDLFASLWLSLPLALCYCLLAWAVTRSWQAMVYLFIGLTVGYFSYEFLHYQAHHRAPRLRVLRHLKKYHLLHHHQSSALRFGVTSPVFDYLFGTFQSTRAEALSLKRRRTERQTAPIKRALEQEGRLHANGPDRASTSMTLSRRINETAST